MIGGLARQDFVGLEDDWTYLDNAGGSFTLRRVVERVAEYMRTSPVQLGGTYPLSRLAAARQIEASTALARWIKAASADEIVLGASATALTWQIARAFRPLLNEGDEIIVSEIEHEANRSPWLWLQDLGVKLRTWRVNKESFSLSLEHLDELLNSRTRLVCFSHSSNILGRIEPVTKITRRAHAAGARVFVDGVAFAPHGRIDVQDWDVDFYACSLYKVFGPHLGLLYGKRDALLELGNINHEYLPNDMLPYKLQPGGVSYELAWGAAGIVDYLENWPGNAYEEIVAHERLLMQPLLEFLARHDDIELIGPAEVAERVPIIAFRGRTRSSEHIVAGLERHKLAARNGHFHARRLLERLKVPVDDGVVRISFAHYNTEDEVHRLLAALEDILGRK